MSNEIWDDACKAAASASAAVAASAMLAALARVTEYAERYSDLADDQHGDCSESIKAARAAIAQAKAAGITSESEG